VVPVKQFGFALAYFTGSKEHNVEIRKRYLKRGWSLSEYGVEIVKKGARSPFGAKRVGEEEIFKAVDLCYIPPELRENSGEFEAAASGAIPRLVEETDLRGSFHTHTTASDGRNTLKDMVAAADKLGWEYIGVSDHSKSAIQANGLSEEQILAQIKEIKRLNAAKQFKTFVFAGVECDILPNGKLDFGDDVLKEFDFVIVSVHSSLRQDEKTMTKRIIRAIEHPCSTILGHVTGRLLLQRSSSSVNLEKVIDACIANKKIMELNAQPPRLDMDWRYWHKASERGLLAAIDADAHATDQLLFVKAGVNAARKGWLEAKHVINTRPLAEIKKLFKA
jgi:DNA polymerase (family 10)